MRRIGLSGVVISALLITSPGWGPAKAAVGSVFADGTRVDGTRFWIQVDGVEPIVRVRVTVYRRSGGILCRSDGLTPAVGLFASDGMTLAILVIPAGMSSCGPASIRWQLTGVTGISDPTPRVAAGPYRQTDYESCFPTNMGLYATAQWQRNTYATVTGHIRNVSIAARKSAGHIFGPPVSFEQRTRPLGLCGRS